MRTSDKMETGDPEVRLARRHERKERVSEPTHADIGGAREYHGRCKGSGPDLSDDVVKLMWVSAEQIVFSVRPGREKTR
jgi:hypothetical protein